MKISVIIPVYNAEKFVEQAVRSALDQPEVAEVILIEDCSPDNALAICERLAEDHGKVSLLRHPNGENRGASASRNLGIENAKCDFVAFLDADDFYLPERFKIAREVFSEDKEAEAVYEAIGTHFENEAAQKKWLEMGAPILTTVKPGTPESRIFEEQAPLGRAGHCSLDGLTVKRSVIKKTGLLDTRLVMGEDTAFFMKLSACSEVRLGEIGNPVTMRRVHDENRITAMRDPERQWWDRLSIWLSVLRWFREERAHHAERRTGLILSKMLYDLTSFQPGRSPLLRTLTIVRKEPCLLMNRQFVAGVTKRIIKTKNI